MTGGMQSERIRCWPCKDGVQLIPSLQISRGSFPIQIFFQFVVKFAFIVKIAHKIIMMSFGKHNIVVESSMRAGPELSPARDSGEHL